MKNDKFQRAFGNIDPTLIERANKKTVRRPKSKFVAIIAAVIAISLCIGLFTWIGNKDKAPISTSGITFVSSEQPKVIKIPQWIDQGFAEDYSGIDVSKYLYLGAKYPEMVQYAGFDPGSPKYDSEWLASSQERYSYVGDRSYLDSYIKTSISEMLSGRGELNSVYSPINIYFMLAMMAEFEDSEGREQILSLLGVESIEELRKNSYDIWNANYSDDGIVTSILANSLWLNNDTVADEDILNVLKETYYSSVYKGEFGSEELDMAFRAWLNENTGGLVDRLSDVNIDECAEMVIASTVMFGARWQDEFRPDKNTDGVFYSPQGEVECEFMNDEGVMSYYWGESFSAIEKEFDIVGNMWFILPDEGVAMDDMLSDEEFLEFIVNNDDWKNCEDKVYVKMSVPKFEIQSDMDLNAAFESFGLTAISDNFGSCRHGAGVTIDEEGVKAMAFAFQPVLAPAPYDGINFVLDRPFAFIIEGRDGLPLFVGIVNNP